MKISISAKPINNRQSKIINCLCLFFWFVCVHGQTAPPVSFSYDADGNMTSRNVVRLEAPMTKSSSNYPRLQTEEQMQNVLTVTLGEQKISIYPNPTSGRITLGVTLLDSEQKNFLRLYDVLGRLQLAVQIQQELTFVEIKGPAGVYLLDVHLGDHVSKWKIIKE